MSLESQVAALVEATNKLTNTVSNKISDINTTLANKLKEVDAAVSKVAADIRATIKGEMRKTVYLDQANGDDANAGTLAAPLKSFIRACANCQPGGVVEIMLLGDYDFNLDSGYASVWASNVSIRAASTDLRPKIKFAWFEVESAPDQYFMRSFQPYMSCTFEFFQVNLELPDVPPTHGVGKRYPAGASVIRSNSSGLAAVHLNVRLNTVEIIVPDPEINEFNIIGNSSAQTTLTTHSVVMPAAWRDRNKMAHQARLSSTTFSQLVSNMKSSFSTDDSVYNDGIVK